jgi:hypothetical protein
MGQLRHGSARTTAALRRAIQQSQESIAKLAKRDDLNPKTVAKWQKRTHVEDTPMGPKQPRSTVLSQEEEALMVAFRRHTLLPLDDCRHALQASLPQLTRSALHRCLKRHGINRLPNIEGDSPPRRSSSSIRSVTSTATWLRYARKRGRGACSLPSTGPASLPRPSYRRTPPRPSPLSSCAT